MKALARFCVRFGLLPTHPRFVRFIKRELFVPLHPRDHATGMTGYFDFGNLDQRAVQRFRAWWRVVE